MDWGAGMPLWSTLKLNLQHEKHPFAYASGLICHLHGKCKVTLLYACHLHAAP